MLKIILFSLFSTSLFATKITVDNMNLNWKLDGANINLTVSAKTKGWVAVGFNPKRQMKGANIIIGKVSKEGKVKIEDHYGVSAFKHKKDKKLRGKSNISNLKGSETNGVTSISFTMPLNSGDTKDGSIDPDGNNTVMLAYGKKSSFKMTHEYWALLSVNLKNGEYKLIRKKK